jgi:hypothetical protein
MKTWCERQGQVEIGFIEHEGTEFRALGAAVTGREVTAYTRLRGGNVTLTTWCDKTMLACRWEVVREFSDGSLALVFRLTRGRFLVGYALGEHGMLFRGELMAGGTDDEARDAARQSADYWAGRDIDDDGGREADD